MGKTKTIVVSHGWDDPKVARGYRYRIERLTDSTEFVPHEFLDKKAVDQLCAANDWKVTVVAKDAEG